LTIDISAILHFINKETGLVLTRNQFLSFKKKFDAFLEDKSIEPDKVEEYLKENISDFQELIEMFLIKESYFFRNQDHFRVLGEIIFPILFDKTEFTNEKTLRVLSVGCSTGQEPLSVLFTFLDSLSNQKKSIDIKIDGVDLSREAVIKAKIGEYSKLELRGLLPEHETLYFKKVSESKLQLKDSLLSKINYIHKNITDIMLADNYYDIIFVRNILIYFDEVNSERVKQKLVKSLKQGGYLFLGESEISWGLGEKIQAMRFNQSLVYRKK